VQLNILPINVPSLKEACIAQLEGLILSGELKMGDRLPSERELAATLNVSRPVLHEALVDLAAKGLLQIIPRRGTYVNDFRRTGSMAILSSLLNFNRGVLDPHFTRSLIAMRFLVENETARLAALHRTPAHLEEFRAILLQEASSTSQDVAALVELDFSFHLLIAIASGNLIYPLILNSFRAVYTTLTAQFFQNIHHTDLLQSVHHYHQQLVDAVEHQDAEASQHTMTEMLNHGVMFLMGEIK